MHAQIPVTLLEAVVLADKVQIVTTDHNRSLHLHLADHSGQDTAADSDLTGEGTFLIDVGTGASLKRKRELRLVVQLTVLDIRPQPVRSIVRQIIGFRRGYPHVGSQKTIVRGIIIKKEKHLATQCSS